MSSLLVRIAELVDFPTNSVRPPAIPTQPRADRWHRHLRSHLGRGGRELEDWASTVSSWLGQFWAEMSGAFRMFRNQQGTRGFVNLSPCICNGWRKHTHTHTKQLDFHEGLAVLPQTDLPSSAWLAWFVCDQWTGTFGRYRTRGKGRSKTNLVDLHGISGNSTSNHSFSEWSTCFLVTSLLQGVLWKGSNLISICQRVWDDIRWYK